MASLCQSFGAEQDLQIPRSEGKLGMIGFRRGRSIDHQISSEQLGFES
jgi:hypothetical protein